jgi:hypothetical protein
VKLVNGRTLIADDAYLLTSIVAPDAQIVAGYRPGFMSSRIPPGSVKGKQANALVAFMKTLR